MSSECYRDLVPVAGNDDRCAKVLELVVPLTVFSVVSSLKYKIPLKAVVLEPVDIAEAKIRELQDELCNLRMRNQQPLLLTASASQGIGDLNSVPWETALDTFTKSCGVVEPSGEVRVFSSGTYVVTLILSLVFQMHKKLKVYCSSCS